MILFFQVYCSERFLFILIGLLLSSVITYKYASSLCLRNFKTYWQFSAVTLCDFILAYCLQQVLLRKKDFQVHMKGDADYNMLCLMIVLNLAMFLLGLCSFVSMVLSKCFSSLTEITCLEADFAAFQECRMTLLFKVKHNSFYINTFVNKEKIACKPQVGRKRWVRMEELYSFSNNHYTLYTSLHQISPLLQNDTQCNN